MIVFGQPVFIWFGLLAAIFIFSAVAAVRLGRKHKQILRGQWHPELARVGAFFAALHVFLAIMRVFFGVYW